jgi:ribosome-binding protein aMBF1 (putative translation factor)
MTATDPDRLTRALADLDADELDPTERDRIAAALEGAHRRRQDRKAWARHELGRRLRAARGDRTQREIAEAVGVHEKYVSRWETGERMPDDENRRRLAEVLGVELVHLHPELEVGPS